MDQNILSSIREIVDKNNQISIAVGKNSTVDEMGSALSLYLALKNLGKEVSIASPKEPIVELSNLVGINKVKTNLEAGSGSGDLTVSFPYAEGEIEKVSYTLENGYLNIIVKAGQQGLSFSQNDIKFQRGGQGQNSSILFIIGTPNLSDLGHLFNPEILKDTTVVNIDNKAQNQGYGDIVLVSPSYSSVSEIIAELLTSMGLEIDSDIAQNLLLGISFATENFQSPKTSSLAFEMAGILMKKGAVRLQRQSQPQVQAQPQPAEDFYDEDEEFFDLPAQRDESPFLPPMPKKQQPFPQRQQFFDALKGTQRQQPQQRQNQPPQQQQAGQQQAGQPQRQEQQRPKRQAPPDWLVPKVYKGSSNV